VKLQLAVLPEASVAVHVTVVVPTGNAEPEVTTWLFWLLQTTVTPTPDVVTLKLTGALVGYGQADAPAATALMFEGQVIDRG